MFTGAGWVSGAFFHNGKESKARGSQRWPSVALVPKAYMKLGVCSRDISSACSGVNPAACKRCRR
jgi:hypothetical protein